MNAIAHFLGGYADNLVVAIGLWPIASFVLTLPILAYLYHRDGRIRFASAVSVYLVVLYILGLGCFTLYPLPRGTEGLGITYGIAPQLNPFGFIFDLQKDGISAMPQILANVAFFVPLGFIASRLLRLNLFWSVVIGFFASLAIELTQLTGFLGVYPYAYRTFDVDDLLWNTSGAAIGWLIAAAVARVLPPGSLAEDGDVVENPGFIRRCVALWLDTLLLGIATSIIGVIARFAAASFGFNDFDYINSTWMPVIGGAIFVVIEGVIPWMRNGQTPGGGFVRMTCETRERKTFRRLLFYLTRLVTLACVLWYFPPIALLLVLFYAVKKQMPYDFL